MPYIKKEKSLLASLVRQHGRKKAKQVYYAMINSGEHEASFGAKTKRERAARHRQGRRLKKQISW